MAKPNTITTTKWVCDQCGSDDIACSADVTWDPDEQDWKLDIAQRRDMRCRNCTSGRGFTEQEIQVPAKARTVPASVLTRLRTFLALRGRSGRGGGWAEVRPEDEQLLDALLDAIINAKYEPDADGDRPMEWKLINRTTHNRDSFESLPYDPWQVVDKEDRHDQYAQLAREDPRRHLAMRLRIARCNVGMANDQLDRLLREVEEEVLRKKPVSGDG